MRNFLITLVIVGAFFCIWNFWVKEQPVVEQKNTIEIKHSQWNTWDIHN
jgi:hypothetical protein